MFKTLADLIAAGKIAAPAKLAEQIGTETARIAQKATAGYCRAKSGANVESLIAALPPGGTS